MTDSSERMSHLYHALSEVNQAIVRMDDESLLLPLLCRVAVEFGGLKLAWIGRPESGSSDFEVLASSGATEYMEGLRISTDPDEPTGRGPAGQTWREGTVVIVNDFLGADLLGPWKQRAILHGIGSSACFPIERAGERFAILNVYHEEPFAFDPLVIRLLVEMTRDVTFALDNFDRQKMVFATQNALAARERHFRGYFENATIGLVSLDNSGAWTEANQRFLEIVRYDETELAGLSWWSIVHPDDQQESRAAVNSLLSGEVENFSIDARYVRGDGETIYVHINAGVVKDDQGSVVHMVAAIDDISGSVRDRNRLLLLGEALNNSHNEFYLFDAETLKFDWVSAGSIRNLGYSEEELLELTPIDIKPLFDRERFETLLGPLKRHEVDRLVFETEHERKDGSRYPVEVHIQLSTVHKLRRFIAVILDITERKMMVERLESAARLFTESRDGIVLADGRFRITAVNETFTAMTGLGEAGLIGDDLGQLAMLLESAPEFEALWKELSGTSAVEGEFSLRKTDGTVFEGHVTLVSIGTGNRSQIGYALIVEDLTESKALENQLRQAGTMDSLTRLRNRVAFHGVATELLAEASVTAQTAALILIDVDGFRSINESRGSLVGDGVLVEVAARLARLQGVDAASFRLGADEFALLQLQAEPSEAIALARGIIDLIAEPISVGHDDVVLGASVGVAIFPQDGDDSETLLTHANNALVASQRAGRGRISFFDPGFNESYLRQLEVQRSLLGAIRSGELEMAYQAIIKLPERSVIGFEALLRWNHRSLGAIPPLEVIDAAEETGCILELGDWVISKVIEDLCEWLQMGLPITRLAINVSASQFMDGLLVAKLSERIVSVGVPPECIDLEITETISMANLPEVENQVRLLRQLGVGVSIDDFGTGYSSLSYLRRFNVSNIKIDKSFIDELTTNPEVLAIVDAIVRIASALGCDTTAEGVETDEQLRLLEIAGCTHGQGYLISKPIAKELVPGFFDMHGRM
ncbi:MAG: EAL domain-containing protein [Acidimicrobiaceae bacterium]|nr:EAL domain-containing protein [Acidimicrobiaceae bacterium]